MVKTLISAKLWSQEKPMAFVLWYVSLGRSDLYFIGTKRERKAGTDKRRNKEPGGEANRHRLIHFLEQQNVLAYVQPFIFYSCMIKISLGSRLIPITHGVCGS
jgi:hypothetical protein